MKLQKMYLEFTRLSEYIQSIALLLARITVGYGFYEPAIAKWKDIGAVSQWFASLGIPFPTLNAYMAASTEIVGVLFLILGLGIRIISIPLIIIMLVAIGTVHFTNGFSAALNGYEIPMYYMIFLLIFLSHGAGKFSLDHMFFGNKK